MLVVIITSQNRSIILYIQYTKIETGVNKIGIANYKVIAIIPGCQFLHIPAPKDSTTKIQHCNTNSSLNGSSNKPLGFLRYNGMCVHNSEAQFVKALLSTRTTLIFQTEHLVSLIVMSFPPTCLSILRTKHIYDLYVITKNGLSPFMKGLFF